MEKRSPGSYSKIQSPGFNIPLQSAAVQQIAGPRILEKSRWPYYVVKSSIMGHERISRPRIIWGKLAFLSDAVQHSCYIMYSISTKHQLSEFYWKGTCYQSSVLSAHLARDWTFLISHDVWQNFAAEGWCCALRKSEGPRPGQPAPAGRDRGPESSWTSTIK